VRPTTVLSLVFAALLGLGGLGLALFLLFDHHAQHAKWHYWLAPFIMIGVAVTLWQLTAMYMMKVGRAELRSRPPSRD
jgi:hypothetical protein